ncbi:hypothetical protein E3N88_32276 [Mikania micrantha]|uniref:Uncharacterized protein n=1 Tax=Mikania micrantha TaxID=192012 RepID=A0A5N6M8I7_9ASTR|nr:hypothetical protein E3N88_32276 [Mikania micrantha]
MNSVQSVTNDASYDTTPTPPFRVYVRKKDKSKSMQLMELVFGSKNSGALNVSGQMCKDLPLQISDMKISQNLYPFSIGEADIVLGIQWLSTLNTVEANWNEMFMVFTIDGKKYKLQGESSGPQKSVVFQHLAIESQSTHQIPTFLQPVLDENNSVFQEPTRLPP